MNVGRILGWVAFGLGAFACAGETPKEQPRTLVDAALLPLASCEQADASIRRALIADMNRRLDENLEHAIEAIGPCPEETYDYAGEVGNPKAETSGTNNQVYGVDEADFVKSDSEFVYVAGNHALRILDVMPAAETHEVAKVALDGQPRKLLLVGDRLVVFSSMGGGWSDPVAPECTYGFNCEFTGDGLPTRVTVLDVSNRSAPRVLRELDVSGSLIAARSVGSAIYAVAYDGNAELNRKISVWPEVALATCGGQLLVLKTTFAFEALRAKNIDLIMKTPLSELLPSIADRRKNSDGSETKADLLAGCAGFFTSPLEDGDGFLSLIAFDTASTSDVSTTTIVSRPGAVYANKDSLYVAARQTPIFGRWFSTASDWKDATSIHKFSLAGGRATYAASGVVPGMVLNQFALDEWNSNLRIATTRRDLNTNRVSVLAQSGYQLSALGQVEFAPREDIRSVRFDGDRGNVVTFQRRIQMDPLFVLDLADPAQPRVLGELEIPGFSSYIHEIDAGHLLTVGFDMQGQSSVALQIFDVVDPAEPKQLDKESIANSTSAAQTDHLAFTYFAPEKLLAVPIDRCVSSSYTQGFADVVLYDVSTETGLTKRGVVNHSMDAPDDCFGDFASSTSAVKRTIVHNGNLISISESLLKVSSLTDLSEIAVQSLDD